MRRTVMTTVALASISIAGIRPAPVSAQTTLTRPVWTGISTRAQQQIDSVSDAMQVFAIQDKAKADGFIPLLGWIPTMGTHWVNNLRMFKTGKAIDLNAPVQLMYSPVNGKETLVGAAYAYVTRESDSIPPASFDGNPAWHEHPDLAPPGMRIVMLHVWFVPSPDGPFAGHNPNLPFWAAGIAAPSQEALHDAVGDMRVRKAAMALALVDDTAGLFPLLHRKPAVRNAEKAHGDTIRALLPELDAAAKANDVKRWNTVADKAVAQWDAMRATYIAETVRADSKARITKFLDEMTMGKHDMGSMHH